jgi:hypothetical protein
MVAASMRTFSSGINKGHNYQDEGIPVDEELKKRIIEREKALFNSLSEKEQQYYQAYRLSLVKTMEESWKDNKNWWNKITTMTEDEIETLPNEYIRKFGSFLIRYSEMQQVAHTDLNKKLGGMYAQVKNLDALETQEEKDSKQALKERAIAANQSYQYEQTGYMQR